MTDLPTQTDTNERRRFRFEKCLGRGGFGDVYLAAMTSAGGLEKEVAVKVLLDGLDPRSQAVSRLRDEAQLLALMRHPAILHVQDLVVLNGRVGLVMEYVEGADLDDCIFNEHPISQKALVQVIETVADALEAAYTRTGPKGQPLHLIHRDLKPANIRVGKSGVVKVLDFGIAKASIDNRAAKTQTDMVMGSFPYMAPERFDSDSAEDHPGGDIFALGCVLFEGLAQRRLFHDVAIKNLYGLAFNEGRHRAWINDALKTLQGVEPRLLALLGDMLDFDPDRRPTAKQVVDRCDELIPDLSGASLRKWSRSHKWPEPGDQQGALNGMQLTETGFSMTRGESAARPNSGEATTRDVIAQAQRAAAESAAPATAPTLAPQPSAGSEPAPASAASPPKAPAKKKRGLAGMLGAVGTLGCLGLLLLAAVGVGVVLAYPSVTEWGADPASDAVALADDAGDSLLEQDLQRETPGSDSDLVDSDPSIRSAGGAERGPALKPRGSGTDAVADAGAEKPMSSEQAQELTDSTEGVLGDADPVAAGCGDQAELETTAASGGLALNQRSCLDKQMRDSSLKNTERAKAGRIVLRDAQHRCRSNPKDCADYERLQPYYFSEVDRSDPGMMMMWAEHLYRKGIDSIETANQVVVWSDRAMERRSDIDNPSQFVDSVHRMLQLRAIASVRAYEIAAAARSAEREPLRHRARDHLITWGNYRLSLGRDASKVAEQCYTVAGSREICDKRLFDRRKNYTISFLSIPNGGEVYLNGEKVGATRLVRELPAGEYKVRIVTTSGEGTRTITVGPDQPNRFNYRATDDDWRVWTQ